MRRRSLIAAMLGAAVAPVATLRALGNESIAPDAALARIVEKYRSLSSYADETVISGRALTVPFRARSTTVFQAPDKFSVQLTLNEQLSKAFLFDGSTAAEWGSTKGWENVAKPDFLLAGLFGMSIMGAGIAYWVVTLLLPPELVHSGALGELEEIACRDAQDCRELSGRNRDTKLTLRINPRTTLIEEYVAETDFTVARAKCEPVVNSSFDFQALAAAVREAPERTLKVPRK